MVKQGMNKIKAFKQSPKKYFLFFCGLYFCCYSLKYFLKCKCIFLQLYLWHSKEKNKDPGDSSAAVPESS